MHPQSHFGLAALIPEITKFASWGKAEGISIGINDMSLPLGGRFDVTANGEAGGRWMDSPHHCSHRNGNAFDFKTSNITDAQRKRARTYWSDVLKHSTFVEGDHDHYKLPPEKK